jgi:hypothetical protein
MEKISTKKDNEIISDIKDSSGADKKKNFFLKRWWDSYLGRLNKVTKGKPQCCK